MLSIFFYTPPMGKLDELDISWVHIRPELLILFQVLCDFAERFKNANPNCFTAKWKVYADGLCVTMREFYRNQNYTDWQDDIERILMLLVAFPFKPNGRKNNADPILSFKKAVNKLIVFRKVMRIIYIE